MKKLRKNKKALSHVEVMISFVIFVGFVVFLLIMLNPLKSKNLNYSYLDETEKAIIENLTTKISVFSVKLNIEIPTDSAITYLKLPESFDGNLIMKDEANVLKQAENLEESIILEEYSNDFNILFLSEELIETEITDKTEKMILEKGDYTLGVEKEYNMLSLSKINDLKLMYDEHYNELKKDFGLENDFNIIIKDINGYLGGDIEIKRDVPLMGDVLVREIPIEILDIKNANFESVILNIQVWD